MSNSSLSVSSENIQNHMHMQQGHMRLRMIEKSPTAFRTISEVAEGLNLPQHVLRFWEGKFHQIKPLKRGGGRRYYRPEDVQMLDQIKDLLHNRGYTIRGVQKLLKENGTDYLRKSSPVESIVRRSDSVRQEATNAESPKVVLSSSSRDELSRVLRDLKAMKTTIESLS